MTATTKTARSNGRLDHLDASQVSTGGNTAIEVTRPYRATLTLLGTAPLLFHSWNVEAVAEKAAAAKGSRAKKEDDVESYVYRLEDGRLGLPGRNFHSALIEAGRYMQDPRSPRKSARDLVRAAIVPLDVIAPLIPDTQEWDYLDRQRVTVQRAGITRCRPAMREGWSVRFAVMITLPQYIRPEILVKLAGDAGTMVGLGDFRPTYGRFAVAGADVSTA